MSSKTINFGNIDIANDKLFTLFSGMNALASRDI